MESRNYQHNLIERIYWLIKLRWIAVSGVFLAIFFATSIINIPLPEFPLYFIGVILGTYNLLFLIYINRLVKKGSQNFITFTIITNKIAKAQISLDLICLTALIHFSGGIENPFIFYYIFHMIIASILLSKRDSFAQATFAIFLFFSILLFEYFKILPHHCLKGVTVCGLYTSPIYILGISFVFVSTLYIAVYMATSISAKLREREVSLQKTNELLKEKDRLKNEYVLRVTHDIKEHLSVIQNSIALVTQGIAGSLNNQQIVVLKIAECRTEKLLSFVKELLEITRIKLNGRVSTGLCSINKIIKDAVHSIESRAKNKNITLTTEIEAEVDEVMGIETYLEEAISNILANAVKYTPQSGMVALKVANNGNSIFIQIKDTGIGIPKDELPKIFDEFYRANNAKELEKDGTGLGLAIAKQVIDRHSGKIWAASEEGKGSTFYVKLPKCE